MRPSFPTKWERGTIGRRADGGEGRPQPRKINRTLDSAVNGACPLHHPLFACGSACGPPLPLRGKGRVCIRSVADAREPFWLSKLGGRGAGHPVPNSSAAEPPCRCGDPQLAGYPLTPTDRRQRVRRGRLLADQGTDAATRQLSIHHLDDGSTHLRLGLLLTDLPSEMVPGSPTRSFSRARSNAGTHKRAVMSRCARRGRSSCNEWQAAAPQAKVPRRGFSTCSTASRSFDGDSIMNVRFPSIAAIRAVPPLPLRGKGKGDAPSSAGPWGVGALPTGVSSRPRPWPFRSPRLAGRRGCGPGGPANCGPRAPGARRPTAVRARPASASG